MSALDLPDWFDMVDLRCPPRYRTRRKYHDTDGWDRLQLVQVALKATNTSHMSERGDPLVLIPWQAGVTLALNERRPDGRLRYRRANITTPKRVGKSVLLSTAAIADLLLMPDGSETYVIASTRDQAQNIYGPAREMVMQNPELSKRVKPYKRVMENRETGSIFRVLASDVDGVDGITVAKCYADEIHRWKQRGPELFATLSASMSTVPDSQLITISTAGDDKGQLQYELYDLGRRIAGGEIDDDSTAFFCWEAPEGSDWRDPETWRMANPALGYHVSEDDYEQAVHIEPESSFRRLRLNQWVSSRDAWPIAETWRDGESNTGEPVPDGAEICLGFDGSYSQDSTALVACTVDGAPFHVSLVELWERPATAGAGWRVDRADVLATIRAACERWQVRWIAADYVFFSTDFDDLESEGFPMMKVSNSDVQHVRRTKVVDDLFHAGDLTHDGDPRLARHVENAVMKVHRATGGVYFTKDDAAEKIDAAMAMSYAVQAAATPHEADVPNVVTVEWA